MNELIHGDCLEEMPKLESGSIDLVLADVPYGTTACKWDTVIPFKPMWEQLKRLAKGAIVMTASQPFTSALVMSNVHLYKYNWYWEKSQAVGHLNAYKMPMKIMEDICVFYENPPTYNPQLKNKKLENIRPETKVRKNTSCYGDHSKESARKIPADKTLPSQLLQFNNSQGNHHSTEKPVKMMEYFIKTYTNEGDTVLDFTMGSGTTGVACVRTGRHFIGIEKDAEYFEIAEKRIAAAQPALF